MSLRAIWRAAPLLALPLLLSGCDLLLAAISPELDRFPLDPGGIGVPVQPGFGTAYGKGTATIELTQAGETQTITLERIGLDSSYDSQMGAWVTWQNDDGWTLTLNAFEGPMGELVMPGVIVGDVTIDLMPPDGGEYWTAGTYSALGTGNGCALNVWEMSETGLAGQANCQKLRWTDGWKPSFDEPAYVDGQESFDVSITFEAKPIGDSQSS